MKPEPVPSSPFTLIMTTLGRTRATMPATESAGLLISAGAVVPRLYLGCVPVSGREPTNPPIRPPTSADVTAMARMTTSSRDPASQPPNRPWAACLAAWAAGMPFAEVPFDPAERSRSSQYDESAGWGGFAAGGGASSGGGAGPATPGVATRSAAGAAWPGGSAADAAWPGGPAALAGPGAPSRTDPSDMVRLPRGGLPRWLLPRGRRFRDTFPRAGRDRPNQCNGLSHEARRRKPTAIRPQNPGRAEFGMAATTWLTTAAGASATTV